MPSDPADAPLGRQERLTASEVGRYTYCARAWWLQRVRGEAPRNRAALERGTRRHQDHVHLTRRANRAVWWVRYLALAAMILAACLALSWIVRIG
jgi:hypothetical protein